MKSYIDYFEPGGEVRYIKRYITPELSKEIPHNTTSSYTLWLMRKLFERNEHKENNVKTAKTIPIDPIRYGSRYLANLHTSFEHPSDTITVGGHTFIINNKPGS